MRVLLTQHAPVGSIGGTQTWVRTVAEELSRRGHLVGVACATATGLTQSYDLAFVSQNSTADLAREHAVRTVYVSHGIHDLERPDSMCNDLVAVSEEVREKWWNEPFIGHQAEVVRQPINTSLYCPLATEAPKVDVLRVSTYGEMEWLEPLCEEHGWSYRHLRHARDPHAVAGWMRRARVVVAVGRAALEAMSCGRMVVVADHRVHNPGAMIDGDPIGSRWWNYSGRGGFEANPDTVLPQLQAAMSGQYSMGTFYREHVMMQHEVSKIVNQLLMVAE